MVWASPPCRTFSPADYSNISRNNNFQDRSQPHKPPTNTNPCKARVANEHDLLVQYLLDFFAYLKSKGAQFKSAMENPRGLLEHRPCMSPCNLPPDFIKDTVDQCVFGRDCRKTTHIWNDVGDCNWVPTGTSGDGRCHGECGKGRLVGGYCRHFKALAMKPLRGPRGKGHTKEENALPFDLLSEIATKALY